MENVPKASVNQAFLDEIAAHHIGTSTTDDDRLFRAHGEDDAISSACHVTIMQDTRARRSTTCATARLRACRMWWCGQRTTPTARPLLLQPSSTTWSSSPLEVVSLYGQS